MKMIMYRHSVIVYLIMCLICLLCEYLQSIGNVYTCTYIGDINNVYYQQYY